MNRLTSLLSISTLLSSVTGKSRLENKGEMTQRRGKYWSLPQDQCAICAENASFNLNFSEPSNAFSSLAVISSPSGDSAPESETEPPAFPIYNPYLAACGDIYCYHCIAERMIQVADAGEGDLGWECLRCAAVVKATERYTVELGSDVSGSDYELSDLSGSIGSYTEESGWSDDYSVS